MKTYFDIDDDVVVSKLDLDGFVRPEFDAVVVEDLGYDGYIVEDATGFRITVESSNLRHR